MIAKKMVMSKNIKLLNKRLLSVQLKKALLYAFLEAKKNKTTIIDSQLLLYGILKVNSSLANKLIRQIYKSKSPSFNSMDNFFLIILHTLERLKGQNGSFPLLPHFNKYAPFPVQMWPTESQSAKRI